MANPATLPAAAIVALLTGQAGLTAGTNLFSTAELAQDAFVPAQAVFVQEYGGETPQPYFGNSADLRDFSVQILVRGNPEDPDGTRTLAWAIWPLLQRASSSGYIDVRCRNSGPLYLGLDEVARPKYTINLSLRFKG